jgi:glucose/arabinose dehydrogenase
MGHSIRSRLRRARSCSRAVALSACASLAFACTGGGSGGGDGGGGGGNPPTTKLEPAFGGLTFSSPVKLVQHPRDADRWYVVEQGGKIWTFLASNPAATKTLALDIVASPGINVGGGGEQGLLGLAFDPDFGAGGAGGELYLTYTDANAGDSMLARYQSPDDDGPFTPTADPIVLAIPHGAPNHNGGDIEFGKDRFLYYSMGDGADGSNGQRLSALLGKVMRLDVLGAPASGEKYAVPNANPFQTAGRPFCDSGQSPTAAPCPEIFAYGFRNPWRMNFDPATDQLWIGDVGESRREEIDLVLSGRNYGWNCVEGDLLGPNMGPECNGIASSSQPPEAVHDRTDAQAIIGGAVYRGSAIPALVGFYVYGDDITQRFFAFHIDDTAPPTRLDLDPKHVSAFGQGRDGEIYVVSLLESPSIYKLVPAP